VSGLWAEAAARRRLGLAPGAEITAPIREFQRRSGLVVTGEIDEVTRDALERTPTAGMLPTWYGTERQSWVVGHRLGDSNAIRRFQSAVGLVPTGVVDEATATKIGD